MRDAVFVCAFPASSLSIFSLQALSWPMHRGRVRGHEAGARGRGPGSVGRAPGPRAPSREFSKLCCII